ncbi:MAG TPA: biotin/lipoyl-containing protein, partial [Burkholderiaceae bacterium]|nr:biotin/lipoyl-containing protein [Burkholderiaceae bacterium]
AETWRLEGTPGALTARCGDARHRIDAVARESRGSVRAVVDGRPLAARVATDGARSWWLSDGAEIVVDDLRLSSAARAAAPAAGALHAPMHGRVTQVAAAQGARVEAGALLLVMEAMKMEHRLHAPFAGTVASVHARIGDQVGARQLLVEVAP